SVNLRIRRRENAQRISVNFRANGRKQRRKCAGGHAVGRTPIRHRASRCPRQVEEKVAVTTIVSLAARDFIVVGCDSLATTSRDLLFPHDVASTFFDPQSGDLRLDSTGTPLLKNALQVWERAKGIPFDQLPSVTKLYDL